MLNCEYIAEAGEMTKDESKKWPQKSKVNVNNQDQGEEERKKWGRGGGVFQIPPKQVCYEAAFLLWGSG